MYLPTLIQYTTRPIPCTNDYGPLTIFVIEPMTLDEHSFRVPTTYMDILSSEKCVHDIPMFNVCNNNLVNPTKIVNTRYP